LRRRGVLYEYPKVQNIAAEDATNVVLHTAISSSNSIESAVQDLQEMHPISKIPCADTVHAYINVNDIDEMMVFFRKINSELIDMVNITDSPQDIAIDSHNVQYYGDKNIKGVVGIQPKNGTS